MRPTFIGIGAQKSASSWLYEMLRGHPEVAVSDTKELNFFSYCFENGFRWYEGQFVARPGVVQAGEVSPSYLHEPGVVARAKSYAPDLRVLVSLRDPVERALSQHRHMVREGLISPDDLSFETALDTNPTYVEQGLYAGHLSRWVAAFGRDRLHAVLMEDIKHDSAAVVRRLYEFLEITPTFVPGEIDEPRNKSYVIRNPAVHTAVTTARLALTHVAGDRAWKSLGNMGLRRLYHGFNRAESSAVIPTPRPETLERLRQRFRPDVEALEELLDRDLGAWCGRTVAVG